MKSIVRIGPESKRTGRGEGMPELDTRVELIRALIPLGLEAVQETLEQEVTALAGERYRHGSGRPGHARWGRQAGSVYLAEQKVAVQVPRVRDLKTGREVALTSYGALKDPRPAEEAALRKVLKGLSCRDYESCVAPAAQTLGLSASNLSRRFQRASARQLAQLQERDLSDLDLVALFLDGKTFGEDAMVIALGVTIAGEKIPLGFVQTATENESSCAAFLRGLVDRGLRYDRGLLAVIDGAKGLARAVRKVFDHKALVQRCRWHKRENVVGYLPESLKPVFRRKLSAAYARETYAAAAGALQRVRAELAEINASAAASLEEGMEETLTLHRLGLAKELGRSLGTTNGIENLNSLVGLRTDKVDRWRNADQKHRWLAAALLEIQPRLRKVFGYRHLTRLRTALQREGLQQSGVQVA